MYSIALVPRGVNSWPTLCTDFVFYRRNVQCCACAERCEFLAYFVYRFYITGK